MFWSDFKRHCRYSKGKESWWSLLAYVTSHQKLWCLSEDKAGAWSWRGDTVMESSCCCCQRPGLVSTIHSLWSTRPCKPSFRISDFLSWPGWALCTHVKHENSHRKSWNRWSSWLIPFFPAIRACLHSVWSELLTSKGKRMIEEKLEQTNASVWPLTTPTLWQPFPVAWFFGGHARLHPLKVLQFSL